MAIDDILAILFLVLAVAMTGVGVLNWLNRRHGGFLRGWAGAVFIGICWSAAMLMILIRVRS